MKEYLNEHEKVKALAKPNKELTMSLEEYDEAYEEFRVKHESLTKTHDDLLTSMRSLMLSMRNSKSPTRSLSVCLMRRELATLHHFMMFLLVL